MYYQQVVVQLQCAVEVECKCSASGSRRIFSQRGKAAAHVWSEKGKTRKKKNGLAHCCTIRSQATTDAASGHLWKQGAKVGARVFCSVGGQWMFSWIDWEILKLVKQLVGTLLHIARYQRVLVQEIDCLLRLRCVSISRLPYPSRLHVNIQFQNFSLNYLKANTVPISFKRVSVLPSIGQKVQDILLRGLSILNKF